MFESAGDIRRVVGLSIPGLILWSSMGCSDESTTMDVGVDGGDAATDATTDTRRRTAECWSEALERPCCFSRSNADRLDSPELLVVYLAPTEPAAFLGVGNVAPFVEMVQSRRLTWLLDLEVAADGATTLVTGSGRATEEDRNVYGFLDPTTNLVVDGTIVDETLNTEPSSASLTLSLFDQRGLVTGEIVIEHPAFEDVRLTEDRTCVGELGPLALTWSLDVGFVTGFVTVESSSVGVLPNFDISLCQVMAGTPCTEPRSEWTHKPDSLCEAGACAHGACDPDVDCNAYRFRAHIGAAGTEIVTPEGA